MAQPPKPSTEADPPRRAYFTPGPAKLPREVLEQVHAELSDYQNLGLSVLEMSHRSKEFDSIINEAEINLRKLLQVPDNYAILFMHGGAKAQFDSVPMNLAGENDAKPGDLAADYILSGSWSKMAADDAEKYVRVTRQRVKSEKFDRLPRVDEIERSPAKAAFRFYCDNETIQGIEFNYVPETGDPLVPLVSDMTSNFLSRPVDVSKFGIIFAGAQKNAGVAGLCFVIVRKDLIGRQMKFTPTLQNYQVIEKSRSLYNTPLTFNIYVANLCFLWLLKQGGLEAADQLSVKKSSLIYDAIDSSGGFYISPVERNSRSRMNVTFLLKDSSLDQKFLEQSKAAGLYELKGHRSVGGFRASLYHGVTLEDTRRLREFMLDFKVKYTPE